MKHPFSLTLALILLFVSSQIIGLLVVKQYVDVDQTEATGILTYRPLPYAIERPQLDPLVALFFLLGAVIIGTGLLFVIIRFKKVAVWKAWYFLSLLVTLSIALAAFLPQGIALLLAAGSAFLKITRSNVFVQNITELFMYGGLAAIFVPVLNLPTAAILLIGISVYDAFAVWKSKHMIKLAKFQTSSGIFAGISLPYGKTLRGPKKIPAKTAQVQTAILGGGDMGFPLIFAGVAMTQLGFYPALLIPIGAALALAALFANSKTGRFYPAMPFITTGCFVGYGIASIL